MEETLRQKQLFLRENILDKGYSTDNFMDLLHSKKGEQGLDLNNWTMRELSSVVKEFISSENPEENEEDMNQYIETDEDYERKCFQQYKENKQKENQEYGKCSKIETSKIDGENLNIKVILENKDINQDFGNVIIETDPYNYQVRRNFGDFEWILNYLNEEYMNYAIPQLSNKNYGEKITEEKALKRTRALNKFLEEISGHPTLKYINILNDFLSINSEEDFREIKQKYISKDKSKENKEKKLSLEDIKSLNGKIKISINKEKEVYIMNIKDNTKINESILKKINKSYKDLIGIMNNACEKMKEISDLWKLLHDKSLKYYETAYTSESYQIMSKIMDELLVSEKKKISLFDKNIREYFRFVKNEFHALNNLANKVDNYKENYMKANDKLKEDKEKLFKEQDINSWGLNENDLKHKNVFLKNKELAFSKMMPEETKNVIEMKNIYGAYLNSLIDEYERIRLLNGKKNKENTINILKTLGGNFKFINISCESHIDNFVLMKDDEINDNNMDEYQNDVDSNNIFNNNQNRKNQYYNNKPRNNQINFRNNNSNNMRMNNNQNNRININQPRINNNNFNQFNRNNNTNKIQKNINIDRNIRNRNPNINQNNNDQYNINNNYYDNFMNINEQKGNNIRSFDINENDEFKMNDNNINNNYYNKQFNRNNNNNNQSDRKRNINQYNMDNRNINTNNINNINNINPEPNKIENNKKTDFYDINNINDYKNINDVDENYDFRVNRNNDINIYEF